MALLAQQGDTGNPDDPALDMKQQHLQHALSCLYTGMHVTTTVNAVLLTAIVAAHHQLVAIVVLDTHQFAHTEDLVALQHIEDCLTDTGRYKYLPRRAQWQVPLWLRSDASEWVWCCPCQPESCPRWPCGKQIMLQVQAQAAGHAYCFVSTSSFRLPQPLRVGQLSLLFIIAR
jgi:hypothetical protein